MKGIDNQAEGRFKWGGRTTAGFDCSGFVAYVFSQLYPQFATKFSMAVADFKVSGLFEDVLATDFKPGDIVIFPASAGNVDHIGIVLDANNWIGSQSSPGVAAVKFTNPWWGKRTKVFRRLKIVSTASVATGRGGPVVGRLA